MSRPHRFLAALALSLTLSGGAMAFTGGDPVNGEKVFKKCKLCHTTGPEQKKIGPSLAGILGRRPGAIEGFGYSQDMLDFGAAGNVWNPQALDLFLTKPRAMLPRTKMAFFGLDKETDRADVIAYLAQF